jgi:hypothetical protein
VLRSRSLCFVWYQTDVCRVGLIPAFAALCVGAACGEPDTPPPTSSAPTSVTNAQLNPAKVTRVRGELPAGYEVTDLSGPATPAAFWGLKPGWTTEPPQCAPLAGPPSDAGTTKGWSGSGPGGIVHVVVTGSPASPVAIDAAVLADCGQWTVASGNTNGTVNLVEAPPIENATTVGMDARVDTVVEGGTQTASSAYTFSAYAEGYLTFVTLVTDPGSTSPALGPQFAADLLVKTVSALRG